MKKSEKEIKLTKSEAQLFKDLYLNKKIRREYKIYQLKMQRYTLQNKDFTIKPTTKAEYKQRVEDVEDLTNSINGLYVIEDAYKFDEEMRMINCRFKLFKKGRAYIIANTYESPHRKKKINKTFHFMPNGLPIKRRKMEYKYRNKFEFSDYELIDEGIFKQVFDEIRGSKISYKGKIYNFRIKYHGLDLENKHYRIKMMRFEKR